jgi:uncharacterized membrane protein
VTKYGWLLLVHVLGAFLFLSGSIVAGVLALAAMRRDAQESAPRQGIRVEMAVRAFNRTLTEPVFFPCTRGIRFR